MNDKYNLSLPSSMDLSSDKLKFKFFLKNIDAYIRMVQREITEIEANYASEKARYEVYIKNDYDS